MADRDLQQQSNSLFWWNFPVLADKLSDTDGGFTREIKYFLDTGELLTSPGQESPSAKSNPTMVFFLNTRITELDHINHDEYEQEVINRLGLDFYLWEPLCYANTDNTTTPDWEYHGIWNCGFYAEMHHTSTTNIICSELDSIYTYCERNNLRNVTVHTCDYNVDKITEFYSDRLNIVCNDVFLKHKIANQGLWPENLEKNIEKTFLSTTWRFTPARWIINCMLSKYSTDMTWAYKTTTDFSELLDGTSWISSNVLQHYPLDYQNDLLTGSRRLNLQAPISMDIKVHKALEISVLRGDTWPKYTAKYDNANPSFDNFIHFPLRKYYSRCFVDVISETRFAQATSNVSEKLLQSMMFKTPFIMVAPPHTLEYIKKLGYKTFNDFWDESYDSEEDHALRLHKLYHLFEQLDQMSSSEQQQMYSEMSDVLQHNHDHYKAQSRVGDVKSSEVKDLNRSQHTEIQWTQ